MAIHNLRGALFREKRVVYRDIRHDEWKVVIDVDALGLRRRGAGLVQGWVDLTNLSGDGRYCFALLLFERIEGFGSRRTIRGDCLHRGLQVLLEDFYPPLEQSHFALKMLNTVRVRLDDRSKPLKQLGRRSESRV